MLWPAIAVVTIVALGLALVLLTVGWFMRGYVEL